MNTIKKFTEGFDKNTFTGIGYLLWLNIKKQVALWVFVAIIILLSCFMALNAMNQFKNEEWMTLIEVKLYVQAAVIAGTLIPLLLISVFSIPSTLNSLHKSTLIKRIGATRLNERSFTTIVFIWYFIIALATISIFYFGIITLTQFSGIENQLLNGWFKTYIFSIFVVALLVSIGILLGTLPISQAFVTGISVLLFILSLLFGGFLLPLTNGINTYIPFVGRTLLMINPLGFSSFAMASILSGTYGIVTTIVSLIYIISTTLLFFFTTSIIMSFNKIN